MNRPSKYFDYKMGILWVLPLPLLAWMWSFGLQDTLDSRLCYSGGEASLFLQSLSYNASTAYIRHQLIDLLLIVSYTSLLFLNMSRAFSSPSFIKYFALLPGLFDVVETSSIILFLSNKIGPDPLSWLGTMTFLKWVSGGVLVALVLFKFTKDFLEDRVHKVA